MTSEAELVRVFVEALHSRNAGIFVGAGLSTAAGFVDWKGLLREIAEDLNLDIDREHDLISLAQFHQNTRQGRAKINQVLIQEFTQSATITENHKILARLPITTYWTTNYDTVLEQALREYGSKVDVKFTAESLAVNVPRRNAVVHKMHGDISLPHEAVLTKDDYETYNVKRQLFTTALQGDLVEKTLLFLGFSFTDPNLDQILSRIRVLLGKSRREHFCVFKRIERSEFSNVSDFRYAQTRRALRLQDLSRYGIMGVEVSSYSAVTNILARIERRYLANSVFISGAAATYAPFPQETALKFVSDVAAGLSKNGFQIVSGFGHGVGSAVVNGVLAQMELDGFTDMEGRISLRPFPQFGLTENERVLQWDHYRRSMILRSGIAIFLFGNKLSSDADEPVPSEGMRKEYEIAVANKRLVVPVGATGYMSKTLHKETVAKHDEIFGPRSGLKGRLNELAKIQDLPRLGDAVIGLVTHLRDHFVPRLEDG